MLISIDKCVQKMSVMVRVSYVPDDRDNADWTVRVRVSGRHGLWPRTSPSVQPPAFVAR